MKTFIFSGVFMKTEQRCWSREEGCSGDTTPGTLIDAQLVLLFGHPSNLQNETLFKYVNFCKTWLKTP